MPWWSFPVIISAPLVTFALAWSLGRAGDYGLASARRGLVIAAVGTGITVAAFLAQLISYWIEGNIGRGFWIATFGTVAGLTAVVAEARALRRTEG